MGQVARTPGDFMVRSEDANAAGAVDEAPGLKILCAPAVAREQSGEARILRGLGQGGGAKGCALGTLRRGLFKAYGEKAPGSRALRPKAAGVHEVRVEALIFKGLDPGARTGGEARHRSHPYLIAEGFKERSDDALVFLGGKGAGAVDDAPARAAELQRVLEQAALRLPKPRAEGVAGGAQVAALRLAFGGAGGIEQNPIKGVFPEGKAGAVAAGGGDVHEPEASNKVVKRC